jgi:hypothetical protein
MALNLTPQQKMKYDVSFKYQKEYVKVARQKGVDFTAAFAAANALTSTTAPAAIKQLKSMPKMVAQQVVAQQGTTKSSAGTRSTKTVRAARRIANLVKKGTIAEKQGKKTYKSYKQGSDYAKAKKFIGLYKPAVKQAGLSVRSIDEIGKKKPARKTKKSPRKSIRTLFGQGKAQNKAPYYVSKGRTVKIGGGAAGPGVIRKIAGQQGPSFKSLPADERRAIINYLASPQGRKLRGPGARKKVIVQKLYAVNVPRSEMKKAKAQAKAQPKKQNSAQIAARYKGTEGYRQIVKRAKKQGVSTSGGTLAIAKRLAKQQ